ncbi:hypothetical protein C8R44DRAFT_886281 [Mycena epipterygia]|nr:hypothetical protein C8R44DRAFT_886281 [Mycena epipterygia]
MKAVAVRALKKKTKVDKENLLKSYGLNGIEHFLWDFRFSDPYAAYSYDTLHSDDLGKWGAHLWPLLLEKLEELKAKGPFAENMRRFPRWPDLKHSTKLRLYILPMAKVSMTFSRSCVLPCIVESFPPNEPLVHCIRAYQRYHIMIGLRTLVLGDSNAHGKSFDFFKQHAASHVVRDIRNKGTTNHGSTRPGEGFQQEAREAYNRTNKKNVAHRMARIDEIQETIAHIDNNIDETPVASQQDDARWKFGAPIPGRLVNSHALEEANAAFQNFDFRLREFISDTFPEEGIEFEDTIMLRRFQCVYITSRTSRAKVGAVPATLSDATHPSMIM